MNNAVLAKLVPPASLDSALSLSTPYYTLPIDLPGERSRPEYAFSGSSSGRTHLLQLTIQIFGTDEL